jgi:hypothetical protein
MLRKINVAIRPPLVSVLGMSQPSISYTQAPPPSQPDLTFRFEDWMNLFAKREHDALCKRFLEILSHFQDANMIVVSEQDQYYIDVFVKAFLAIFTEADFSIPDHYAHHFIASNHVLMNVVAISGFRTTDAHLAIVLPQQNNLIKILTLLNARCHTKVDRKIIFDLNAKAASLWYAHYACAYYGALQCKSGYENLREHFGFQHPQLEINEQIQEAYFGSTYAGDNLDQIVKPVVNRSARKTLLALPPITNKPDRKKIVVISGLWTSGTSVYRTYFECIKALKADYHLTFIGLHGRDSDHSIFDEVRSVGVKNGVLDFSAIQQNDFQVVLFPDIGMSDISILMANMQIAPIQVGLTGHPVSTFDSKVNYFISGAAVEIQESPEKHYSERLVLLPGMGMVHNVPLYTFRGLKKPAAAGSPLILNALCWSQKINHSYVQTLRKLIDRCDRPIKFRFFVGNSLDRASDRVPFTRNLSEQLGAEHVEIIPPLDYAAYMSTIEQGDITIDSHHFGGSNTVSDSLFCRVPTVTWNSDKWYGRIGSEMLRLIDLQECAADSEEEFLTITSRLVNDDDYRNQIRERTLAADLENTIYAKEEGKNFAKAIDSIIENHDQWQTDQISCVHVGETLTQR